MSGSVPDPAEFWTNLAQVSTEVVVAALQRAGFLSPEQLGHLQAMVAGAQQPKHHSQQPAPAPTIDAPAREEVGAQIGS